MALWTAFILGFLGSLHCAGMCGPLALALPAGAGSRTGFVAGRIAYNLGRLATYAALGLVFGLLGRSFVLAGVQQWLSITLGAALLAGLFASRKLAAAVPVSRFVAALKSTFARLLRERTLASLGLLGLLNGLLPCGLVYVAATAATSTGGILDGALYMILFGLGTFPMMLAIGLSGRLVPATVRLKLLKAVPATVVVLAVLLILRGLALGIPYVSPVLTSGSGSCCHP
ncbi:MAG: sulfite exporter TauE/SafE family protein [Verrucomicrobiota bacterium]